MRQILALVMIFVFAVGCTKPQKPAPKYPERLPITEQAAEQVKPPPYVAPKKGEGVTPVAEGDPAPNDGILLDEEAAGRVAELRIAYDEIYQLNLSNTKYLLSITTIQEQELYRADQIIDQKEAELRDMNNWWHRNKLQVGIVGGIVIGAAVVLLTGKIWSEIEEDQQP